MRKYRKNIALMTLIFVLMICALVLSSCGDEKYLDLTVENTVDGSKHHFSSQYFESEEDYEKGNRFEYDLSFVGFRFGGIFSEPNGAGEMFVDENNTIVSDIEFGEEIYLYFYYIPIDYTLTLVDDRDGEMRTLETITYNYLTDGVKLPSLEYNKENYEFVGWGVEEEITEISRGMWGDKTLYPVFKGKYQTILLDKGDGELDVESLSIRYDDYYCLPEPTPPNKSIFLGWVYSGTSEYIGSSSVFVDDVGNKIIYYSCKGSVSLTAKYAKIYDVRINITVDGVTKETLLYTYTEGKSLDLEAPQMTGYRPYALTDGDGKQYGYKDSAIISGLTEDTTLCWDYKLLQSEVTFDTGEDYFDDSYLVNYLTYGESFTLPMVYRVGGYALSGWRASNGTELITNGKGEGVWSLDVDRVTLVPVFSESKTGISPIYDKATFLEMCNNPAGSYVMFKDVDLTGTSWTPFNFSGTLDGNGRTVKGLIVTADSGNLGMFSSLSGTVKELTLKDINIVSESNTKVNIGGLCGTLSGSVSDVYVYGTVIGDNANLGGIAGSMSAGSIKNSKSYAAISTITYESDATVGGIVGYVTNGTILECENHGDVSGYGNVGGIAGFCTNVNSVTKVKNLGTVTGKSRDVGGIVGKITTSGVADSAVAFNNLENAGAVKGENNVGGCIGYVECYGSWWEDRVFLIDIYKLTNSAEIAGEVNVGGCIGYITASTGKAAFSPKIEVKLTDLNNTGDINASSVVGGCLGYAYSDYSGSKIIRSSSGATVTAEHTAGGIAGIISGIKLVSCTNTGAKVVGTGYYISNSAHYVRLGGFAAQASYIEDCHNECEIQYSGDGGYIGGIAGYATGVLTNVSNSVNINVTASNHVGGIAGYVSLAGSASFAELANSGDITAAHNVGGIFGTITDNVQENSNNTHTLSLSELENSGDIVTTGQFVGGVIGKLEVEGHPQYTWNCKIRVVMTYVENNGNVTASSTLCIGGVFGYVYTDTNESLGDAIECTGTLNGEAVSPDKLAGSVTNFKIA